MLYLGFETGEASAYTGSYSITNQYHASGNGALQLNQVTDAEITLELNELDFTQNTALRYISLEFDHICTVTPNENPDFYMCRLYWKRTNESTWHQLTSSNYNMTNGGSNSFRTVSAFSNESYGDEWRTNTLSNDMWKSERFDINAAFNNVAPNERRLMIKFTMRPCTRANTTPGKWLIDNLKISASPSPMVKPTIKMVKYPDGIYHPSSRGAEIVIEPKTTISSGINHDSVYLFYRVGSDPAPIRLPMTQMTSDTNLYSAHIPFYGYDTTMYFYCVARDATSNANRVTSPTTENSWYEYRCIRGVAQPGLATEQFTGAYSHNLFPFGSNADGRSEWVFDSALLASAGYGPGQMTAMKMTFAAYTPTVTRQRMQIRMKNVPTNYQVDTSVADYYYYTSSYMHIVYDSAFTIGQSNAGGEQTIRFQDTFYYAGKDLVMQLVYDDDDDLSSATSIRMISAPNSKKSIYKYYGTEASMGIDAFNTTNLDYGDNCVNRRPALVMTQRANLPLLYDLGISELVSPSYETPMTQRPGSLTVKLKNFGALPVNAVRISYNIDDTIFGHYDWSGNLAGGADQNVTISNNIVIPAGFHTLKVWVEDTLTISGSQLMRDHEPYNDTSFSQFIVCDGAMSGVRHVGGATPDFNTIEEFLFALSRCGIGDSLVVKLAPGSYNPFTVPAFTGANANAYVVFEPEGNGRVTVFSSEANNRYEDENGAYLPISTSLVNLVDAANVRFRNINFVRYAMPLTDMVTMGLNSANCHFEGCSFIDSLANPAASMRINALINSGYANGLIVDGCTFVGGKTGVDVKGQASDIRSSSNSVMNSTFRNQYDYAVNASNQTNLNVYRNEMYDVLSNSMGVLLLNECNGTTRVTCNKIYTSHGGGGIALNSVSGNAAHHVLVANNMIVCNDDGTANLMRTPFNVITANYTDVVYNSVKMTATSRNNIAAVSFGGGTLQNSQFVNNVVVSLDNNNYALNYAPGSYATNTVGHNVYYSLGSILNRRSGAGCMDLDAWVMNEPADTNSIVTNPNFLNGSLVDLRTFNRLVKGVGIPIANVTTDMFDSVRSTTATCPGAFEFVSLAYDFEPEALISPVDETCYMPSSVELKVRLRNSGVNAYTGTGLQLKYKVDNATIQTVNVTGTVPAEDTVTIATGAMLALPSYATSDRTYNIKVWTVFASDPNQTNDTNDFQVVSKYRPAKPNNDSTSIAYATRATITPTSGVNSWAVYGSTSAPQRKSELYWFRDTTDAAPFHVGPTLTTDTLRMDSTFYFRQRRAKPIVRITQVEFNHANNAVGLTPSMPYWVNSGRKTAIQLTNVGDARANLFGDTIQTISPTQTLNNKVFVFTDSVFIEPGQSLVVQCATGNSANPALTIHTGTPLSSTTVSYTSKIAFVYRRGGVIEDAVALNAIGDASTQAITWANIGVPSYVWNGTGVNLASSNTAAGIIRNAFNGNASDWQIASAANPMFINTIRPTWIRYTDNGCEGYFASYKVKMIAPPAADIDLSTPILPATACGLGNENISVTVHNYGINSVSGLVLNYSDGNDTVTENVSQPIAANGVMTYTFAAPLNFAYSTDSLITVRVWADAVSGDNIHSNDTNYASVLSLYTPAAPDTTIVRTVSYANPDTITLPVVSGLVPVWYDYEGNAVDTGYTSISEILYVGGTRGVSYMATVPQTGIIGTGTSIPSNNTTPTPYQPATKYSRQQYIYSASELRAAGLEAGFINSVAFELMTIPGNNVNFVSFNDYTVSMGTTQDTIFSGNSDWKSTTQVSSQSPFVISQSDCNTWVSHPFSSPYYWDGTSSIVVEVSHYIATAVSTGAKSAYTPKTNAVLFKFNSNAITPTTAGGRHANRPNIRFSNTTYGCASAITPYTVQMVNIPSVDMAVLWPNGTDTIHYNSCSNTSFYVNVRNQGASEATSTTLYYYFDTLAVDSTVVTNAIASGATENVLLFNRHMNPGRHTLRVVVAANGDDISSNDTITRSFMVSFCSGTYTIATTGGDYRSFGEAIDTLNVVGIEGPVRFNVSPGIYTEQVVLNNIPGSSATNTIAFYGTGDDVLLTAAPTQNDNYVFLLDSTSNVTLSRFRIEARPPSGNYANALVLQKGGHITIDSLTVRVKGTVNNVNASAVVLLGEVSNLTFVNNTIDSGYYSFRTSGTLTNYQDFTLTNNTFRNFWLQGINVRGITNFVANNNRIRGGINGSNVTGRGLTGLYLAQSAGNISIQRNYIILIDDKNGGKRGIQLENINCGASNPALIANNMISCSGTGTAGLTPAKPSGIWIDSSSSYINVYFNTVRVYCGPYASAQFSDASYSFFSGATVSNIHVMNNIFSNFSKGYAYYVSELNTVNLSNYNDYYTVSARPFAWKSTNNTLADLVALQGINSDDANSVFQEPYFLSDEDLHLVMTNLAGIAQYNSDVPDDIDGLTRKQVPGPTIGAHEMDVVTHDMAVVRIVEPVMPASLNFNPPNNMPPHIESDSVRVIAQFYNNGMAPESNIQWYAYIEGFEAQTRTPNKNIGSFAPAESKMDTVMMPTVLGITDTNIVHVVVILPADSSLSDNDRVSNFYLAPAFNLAATRMSTDHTGCSMQNTVVKITVKNEGFKDVPAGTTFKIGYHPQITQPTTITSIYTMPDTVEQNTTLTTPLLMGQTQTIDFTAPANFYPTGESQDIKFRLMGWVNYSLDITQANDSTNKTSNSQSPVIDAYYSPEPPVGYDTVLPYGTWGEVRASQVNTRPIRWYRDSTATPYYHPTAYNASTKWSNTPQYFHDSVYYLNCLSTKNCPSFFSTVRVSVAPRLPNDMAFEAVLAPLGDRVYMENDTVRVRISNYGTSSQTNVPIAFQLKRGNNIIQNVTEVCPATIPAGQSYDYTFTTLLDIPTPTTAQNYTLTVWTDLATDGARRNDTIRTAYTFRSLAESLYNALASGNPSFDITRVSFNEIDYETPQQGRGYTNLGSYNDPDYPVLHVSRGLSDSIIVEVTPLDGNAQSARVSGWVYIDFNRNGTFEVSEAVVSEAIFYDREALRDVITIPATATPGYMRMRVAVGSYADFNGVPGGPVGGIPSDKNGHAIDFLLFVDPDAPQNDIAVTQIVGPRSYIIDDDTPREVSFRISNKGASPVSGPTFGYSFTGEEPDSTGTGVVSYPGTLAPGSSAVISLPGHSFPYGVTDLLVWSNQADDDNRSNDTLEYQYNRFYVITPPVMDSFDIDNKWYAPRGYNVYSHNYWELGTPAKQRINAPYSGDKAWVTDLTATSIVTGKRGNVSYLYSPIIDIHQIFPDTISVRIRRHLINGSSLRLEFRNFEGMWVNASRDSLFNWYNNQDGECFDGTSSGTTYNYYFAPTNYRDGMRGDFGDKVQFRFVYTTPIGSSATAAFGEGCAIDNFQLGRARRPVDAGIIDIVEPAAPAYGQTIFPKVVVHNYGTDTLREVAVGYIHYGTFLPKECTVSCLAAPGGNDTVLLTSPFVVTSDYPESFDITAFTMLDEDVYYDNDTIVKTFELAPLANDISAHSFIYPLEQSVAGDDLQVTIRMRNFGTSPISRAQATYIINGEHRVDEDVDFEALLGRPLASLEYFNYTFNAHFRAPYGVIKLTGIVKSDQNDYIYNDTITKRVTLVSDIRDIAAAAVIIDSSGFTSSRITLVIENRGGRGVNGFEVGFYIDGDTTQIYREVFNQDLPLAALGTAYHTFDVSLPQRSVPYSNVTGFVHLQGDNDSGNDTTNAFAERFLDLEMAQILIIENSAPTCQVIAYVVNRGNVPVMTGQVNIRATINGNSLNMNSGDRVAPGEGHPYYFERTIPKSPNHTYEGSAKLNYINDLDSTNDQSNYIVIYSYWDPESVPTVNGDELVLDQNYPNPFEGRTTVPFTLPNDANVRIFVIDAMGHVVNSFERFFSAGQQTVTLDLSAYSSGIYYYGIEVDGQRLMRKMILR
ncbi:MAG: T9SS type A sorting domain-containing protein [Bacteroidales bacterium]|nr:T9SS type A sorting domain-containing protein [Bacteroidales bacterium]